MGARLVGLPVFPVGGGLPPQRAGALALVIGAQGRSLRLHLGETVRRLPGGQRGLQKQLIGIVGLVRHEIRPGRLVHRAPGP